MQNLLVLLFLLLSVFSFGQNYTDPDKKWAVYTKFGYLYVGQIISYDDESLIIQTKTKKYRIFRKKITHIEDIEGKVNKNGKYIPYLTETRGAAIIPNGYDLEKGQWKNNYFILLNQLSYGVTDNISVKLGCTFPIPFVDERNLPISLIINGTFPFSKKIKGNVSLGYFNVLGFEDSAGYAANIGVTYGSRFNNFRVGYLKFFYNEGANNTSHPFVISGSKRITPKIILMTENMWMTFSEGIEIFEENSLSNLIFIRVVNRKHSFDFGMMSYLNKNELATFIPYLSWSVNFNPDRKLEKG